MLYRHFFKRLFDFVIALIGLIIISPLFLLLWIRLSLANKGAGAFFFQERPGITGWAQGKRAPCDQLVGEICV